MPLNVIRTVFREFLNSIYGIIIAIITAHRRVWPFLFDLIGGINGTLWMGETR